MSKTFKALQKAEEDKQRQHRQASEEQTDQPVRLDVTLPKRTLPPSGTAGEPPRLTPRLLQECVRLENKLQTVQPGKNIQVMSFASSVHGEGTSKLASSYAIAMSQKPDRRILLMDFNFSSPALHELFGLSENEGLTDALSNGANLQRVLKDTRIDNLKIVTAGTRALLHGKSIDRRALEKILELARQEFDLVIIDAPPILPNPEFAVLSEFVDGTILVIRSGRTRKEQAKRAKKILSDARSNLLGVAMNRRRFFIPQFIYKRL